MEREAPDRTGAAWARVIRYHCAPNHQPPSALALYEMQDATLAGISGEGYVYPVETYQGIQYKGVFFAGRDTDLSELPDLEDATFEGTIYLKTSQKTDTVNVDVTNVTSVAVGSRADFDVVD